MMTCRELAQLLIDFVSDELPQEHRDLIEKHLVKCPPCVTYVETYKLTIQLTRKLPAGPVPESLRERLMASWREIEESEGRKGGEPKS